MLINESYRILQGDSSHIFQNPHLLPDNSIDTIFTSPYPPNDDKLIDELCTILAKSKRCLKGTGGLWIHIADVHNKQTGNLELISFRFAREMIRQGWIFRSDIIWHRLLSPGHARSIRDSYNRFFKDCEHMLFFTKQKEGYYIDESSTVLDSSIVACPDDPFTDGAFPSEFPIFLVQQLVRTTTPMDGTVLDCFCGSGTTGAALFTRDMQGYGFHFIGIEKEGWMIPKIKERLENVIREIE